MDFDIGGLRISTALEIEPGADRLTVVLNAFYHRGKSTAPVFAIWPESNQIASHVLRIFDPTFYLSDWIEACCFLGTEDLDPVAAVIEVSRRIAAKLSVGRENIIYFGHSSAGFGALQCAIRDGLGAAVGINPMIELSAVGAPHIADASAEVFRPGAKWTPLCEEFPERFSVVKALNAILKNRTPPRLGIIQNVTDRSFWRRHYVPFCRAFMINYNGGSDSSGFIQCETYDKSGGHSAFPDISDVTAMCKLLTQKQASSGQHPPEPIRRNRWLRRWSSRATC